MGLLRNRRSISGWLAALLNDLRFAWRLAFRQPLLTAAVVLTIAFGVGANTAIVSVLRTMLLDPAGLRNPDRVMIARVHVDRIQLHHAQTSGVEFRELQSMTDAFNAVGALEGRYWTANVGGESTRLRGWAATPDFFRTFDVHPAAGRFFSPQDSGFNAVLSYGFWQSQFSGDPSVIGRSLLLDGKPYRIVGVTPAEFRFPATAQAWVPLILEPDRLQKRGFNMTLWLFARLKEGVAPAQARDRVNRYVDGVKRAPGGQELADYGYGIDLDPVADYVVGDLRRPLWLLWAAALVVLLIGCANVAGLLLTRSAARRREIAIRTSLGAAPAQIVRQLLTESLLLAALGGACGLSIARIAIVFSHKLPVPGSQWLALAELDRRMLFYGFGLALASGVVFGLVPALQILRESQGAALARARRRWFQDLFVTAQVAGAFVLVVMTVLLLRSLWAVERNQPGFETAHLTTAYFIKPQNDPGFFDRLRLALRTTPGVDAAALVYPLPFSGGAELTSGFAIKNRTQSAAEPEWQGEAYQVSPEYFRTLHIPLLRGRNLADSDTATSPKVCLIDSFLAERFFPHQDPIGQEIAMYGGWARIIGIVGTIRGTALERNSRPMVYYSLAQVPYFPQAGIVLRSTIPAGAIIREAVRRSNRGVPIYDLRTMDDRIGDSLGIRRVLADLLTIFGALALLLAALGIYGVVAQLVSERTREIGIRMALGARSEQIVAQFAREGIRAGVVGLGCGLAAAGYTQQWTAPMLYQVRAFDPITFSSAAIGVVALLLLAIWWPARRASRVDPQQVLHHE